MIAFIAFLMFFQVQEPVWVGEVWAKAGDQIEIAWDCEDSTGITEWRLYRATASENTPQTFVARSYDHSARSLMTIMPGGKTPRYWFKVRPVTILPDGSTSIGPASEELIVNRTQ